jgi:polyphosphate kinase
MAATKSQSKGREADEGNGAERHEKLDNNTCERELARLHAELVKLQLWVVDKGLKFACCLRAATAPARAG